MTNKITWNLEIRKIKDLKQAEYNPRKMSDSEKEQIKESISSFGKVIPLVVNIGSRENIVIGGNQRLKIYKEEYLE